jgi:Kef-type K+ transport system membrane component KefB
MTSPEVATRFLLAVAVAVVAARVLGWGAVRLRQPRVIGEVLAGIMLGPSLLGALWPAATEYLFPVQVMPGLKALAQLGLVLFMFLVGVELEPGLLRGRGRTVAYVELGSLVIPFGLGAASALWLYPRFGTGTDRLSFVLFIGVAMAITAFPVLVRILQDTGLAGTPVGAIAVAAAALDDVTAWCLLAGAVAVTASSGPGEVLVVAALAVAFVLVMVLVVRPVLARAGSVSLPVAVAVALLSAWVTELVGVHAVFGAFVAGVVMPTDRAVRSRLEDQLTTVTTSVLLPVFFVVVGVSVRIDRLNSLYLWGVTALVVLVATVGKMVGATGGALLSGTSRRDALTLGVLMNTRGLTEIVILTVGLELGVIDTTMFSIGVVMALATTVIASPLLRLVKPDVAAAVPR